jgi:hypothetical protein
MYDETQPIRNLLISYLGYLVLAALAGLGLNQVLLYLGASATLIFTLGVVSIIASFAFCFLYGLYSFLMLNVLISMHWGSIFFQLSLTFILYSTPGAILIWQSYNF